MKKTSISPLDNSRKAYEKPSMKVQQMNIQHALLIGSGDKLNVIDEDEEEWPVDPGTNKPYSPW